MPETAIAYAPHRDFSGLINGPKSLAESARLAAADAGNTLGPALQMRVSHFPDLSVPGALLDCMRAWLLFLGGQAGSNRGVIYLTGCLRRRTLEVRLRLFETDFRPAGPTFPCTPDTRELETISRLGGEFHVTSKFPETSVVLKLPLN